MAAENTLFVDKMPQPPILLEKFVVIASAPDCKCSVTATSTLDAAVIVIATHECKGHEERIQQLKAIARQQVELMVNRYVLLPHIEHTAVFSAQPAATSSERSNVLTTSRKEQQ
ncbi:MAG TPA: hypothetical protein VJW20_20450 [Candidatus Angelobacter sp.]|nr:hypothetical protein [Candidatus Angelobacter sp.]